MLSRQGWLVVVGAAALVGAGRLFGLAELFALGLIAALLLLGAVLLVGLARLELEVGRSIHPTRVHVGTPARVELTVRNLRSSRTPLLRLRDPVSRTRGADLLVAPLATTERTVAAYRLPTERRGLISLGPLQVVVGDPFGLTRVATEAAPRVEMTVYPQVERIDPLPYTTGHDPLAGARQPNALGRTGEDFYALRPYVVGDDLRRVHWPSSARHDELLVRQNELPWQGRTTVLLDVRKGCHQGDSLEEAVSVAASVVAATARRNDLVRLMTTDGTDSDFAPGSDHIEAIMEHLAVVPASSSGSLRRSLEMLTRTSSGGALVVILAHVPDGDIAAVSGLRSHYGSVTTVTIDRSMWDPAAAVGDPPAPGVLHLSRAEPFAQSWNRHVARLRAGRAGGPRPAVAGAQP